MEEGVRAGVLDAGALIGLDRGDRHTFEAIVALGERQFVVPAPVLAEVWRDDARQARLVRFLRAQSTIVENFDELQARAAGVILGKSGTSDVVDASVVVAARAHGAVVLTADPHDLRRLDPSLELVEV